jgi:uncharacterized protein (DUF4415 family)
MRRRGESRTDWERAAATTQEEVEAQIAADADEAGMVVDWDSVTTEMPKPKLEVHLRLDGEILDYFRQGGCGYQTAHQCGAAFLRQADEEGRVVSRRQRAAAAIAASRSATSARPVKTIASAPARIAAIAAPGSSPQSSTDEKRAAGTASRAASISAVHQPGPA